MNGINTADLFIILRGGSTHLTPDKSSEDQNSLHPKEFSLSALQEWMQSVLMDAGDSETRDAAPQVSAVILPSSKQTSEERLQVYGNAYFARLLDCLREEFRTLCQFLGEDIFDGLALEYLHQHPSKSPTLADLGASFPLFLSNSRANFGDLDRVEEAGIPPWTQFLIDLATLERVQSEVFDGPGTEGLPLLTSDDLRQISPAQWPESQLELAPCLRLLALDFPIHDFIKACRDDAETPVPAPCPTWLAITRRQYTLRRIPLQRTEFQILRELAEGRSIDEALEIAAASHEDLESLAKDVERWFQAWTLNGLIVAVK